MYFQNTSCVTQRPYIPNKSFQSKINYYSRYLFDVQIIRNTISCLLIIDNNLFYTCPLKKNISLESDKDLEMLARAYYGFPLLLDSFFFISSLAAH